MTAYFKTVSWTGNGAGSRAITGVGFQPDLVLIKARSGSPASPAWTFYHATVGAGRYTMIGDNEGGAIAAQSLVSYDADGFTVGTDPWVNQSGIGFVAFCWKAVANGMAVDLHTGNSTNRSIAHSLGIAPEHFWVKNYGTSSGGDPWAIYPSLSNAGVNNNRLIWGSQGGSYSGMTGGELSSADSWWNGQNPGASTWRSGIYNVTNNNARTYVATHFASLAGHSKFGAYTGDGASNGPSVTLGFYPALVLCKRTGTGTTGSWFMFYRISSDVSPFTRYLTLDSNGVDATDANGLIADGTIFRAPLSANVSGASYMFAAWGDGVSLSSSGRRRRPSGLVGGL